MTEELVTVECSSLAMPRQASGAMALAMMSQDDFDARLAAVSRGLDRVRQIQRNLMTQDEDFGVIPGTKKPSLLKPGAEKLCAFYGLVATYEDSIEYGDGSGRPWITVKVRAIMHLGAEDGPIVGEGLGSANSSESKHKYRSAKRSCPACGSVGSISRSKFPDKNTGDVGWWCRDCKTNYLSSDTSITDQALGQIENPDPADVENTCLKMAKKRAYIDGTLTTTATSGLFTQDLEDMGPAEPPKAQSAPPPSREPGDDDAKSPEPERKAEPQREAPAKASDACPECGSLGIKSKWPKKGAEFFCGACKKPYGVRQ